MNQLYFIANLCSRTNIRDDNLSFCSYNDIMITETKLKKETGALIPVIYQVPEGAEQIVIMVHGFESLKECSTGQMLFRKMIPANIGVVAYDQPGHGTEEARREALTLQNCKDSLRCVEDFVHEKYPDAEIVYFGSSFGAYVTALYVSDGNHRGRRFFMRSAAVNMPDLFLKNPDPEMEEKLKADGYVEPDLGTGQIVQVPLQMFDDFRENNLFEKFNKDEVSAVMVHGEKDAVIDPAEAKAFASKFNIPITFFPGENHSICVNPDSPDRVGDMAIEFLGNNTLK